MSTDYRATLKLKGQIQHGLRDAAGHGHKLDARVQSRLEKGLGGDLSHVRVHTDSSADRLVRAVDAEAFTNGSDIYFRAGAYRPESAVGMYLLAHVAAHVLQQTLAHATGALDEKALVISDPYGLSELA